MLVDHADACGDGLLRPPDHPLFAIDADGAGIGLVKAVEDIHQGRFAGTILPDDSVNRAGADLEIDILVRPVAAEALIDGL